MNVETFILQVILIFFLILANGFFAGSEIAIINSRKSRIKTLAGEEKPKAKKLLALKEDPDKFLSTIQVGITVIGTLASAVGGAAAVQVLTPVLEKVPVAAVSGAAQPLSIVIVVALISYFTLILGELVPKSLGIRFSEKIALFVAAPLTVLSKITAPLVAILTTSTRFVLTLMGMSRRADTTLMTEEEIRLILKEGEEKGVLDETEHELIHSIFDFADRSVKDVMIPHPKIHAIDRSWKKNEILKFISEKGLTRYPVYDGTLDNVVGILNNKDVLNLLVNRERFDIEHIIYPPLFIPDSKLVSDLLREMQKKRTHLALVVDEYGDVSGLVTMEDLLEEIVGEIEDEHDGASDDMVKKYKDGTMIIDGSTSIRDLNNLYGMELENSDDFETIAGLILAKLQTIPKGGEVIRHDGYKFTVVDVEKNRIVKVRAEKAAVHKGLSKKKGG
jgi:putative hemolysin